MELVLSLKSEVKLVMPLLDLVHYDCEKILHVDRAWRGIINCVHRMIASSILLYLSHFCTCLFIILAVAVVEGDKMSSSRFLSVRLSVHL